MKKIFEKISAPLAVAVVILIVVLVVKHFRIDNFHTIKPGQLYSSGQPRGMDYTRLLYKYHIATFVNIRSSDEHRDHNWYNEEIAWMRENGAGYVEMPIDRYGSNPGIPSAKVIQEFTELMSDAENRPVLVHGSSGEGRIAMLVCAWMMETGSWDFDQAVEKAVKIKGQKLNEEETAFLKEF